MTTTTREQRLAEMRATQKCHIDEEWVHYLYRCYDASGVLLYIGCTTDVETRMDLHRSAYTNRIRNMGRVPATSVELIARMVRYEVSEPIKGRRAARAAEKAAIQAEHPLLNVVHNRVVAS